MGRDDDVVVEIENATVQFEMERGVARVLNDVDLAVVGAGERRGRTDERSLFVLRDLVVERDQHAVVPAGRVDRLARPVDRRAADLSAHGVDRRALAVDAGAPVDQEPPDAGDREDHRADERNRPHLRQ